VSNPPDLAAEVFECAIAAGHEVNTSHQTKDGRIVFTAGLGETSFFVGNGPDDTVVVSESDRLQPEYMVFAAPAVSTVDRYLLMTLGSTVRFRQKLPRIRFPVDSDHVAPGFDLMLKPFHGDERLTLVNSGGEAVAWGRSDPIIATVVLVELSHHMAGSISDIAASYLNPSGSPLFDHFVQNKAAE
jgi:hypothetical protein